MVTLFSGLKSVHSLIMIGKLMKTGLGGYETVACNDVHEIMILAT